MISYIATRQTEVLYKMKGTRVLAVLSATILLFSATSATSLEIAEPATNVSNQTQDKNGCWIITSLNQDRNDSNPSAQVDSATQKCAELVDFAINNNTLAYSLWKHPRVQPLMKVWLFNYTNWQRVKDGQDQKLKVEETGPYVYSKRLQRVNVSMEEDQIRYKERILYKNISKTADDDLVVVPNLPLLGLDSKTKNFDFLVQMAIKQMILMLNESAFIKLKVNRFLWGYSDSLTDALGSIMRFGDETNNRVFSLLKNNTKSEQYTLNTGMKDPNKMNLIEKVNGESFLMYWNDQECNRIEGSDGIVFPPSMLDKKQVLYVFYPYICRRLPFVFKKEVEMNDGRKLYRYALPLDVFEHKAHDLSNSCSCDADGACPPKGVLNVTACANGPIDLISYPHFHLGEEKLRDDVLGLHPDAALHESYLDIHPTLGVAVQGRIRFQLNIQVVKKSDTFPVINFLPDGLILPVVWIEMEWNNFCNCESKGTD